MIQISKTADMALRLIQKQYGKKFIAFGLKGGGCGGFQYTINPCDDPLSKFDEVICKDGYDIKIHSEFIFKLIGVKVGYENDVMGNRFTFYNPNSEYSCGCGKSFT